MHGAYLDAIGAHLQIDPHFFCAHFQLSQPTAEMLPVLLPSERYFLQITQNKHSHMTALFKKTEDCLTSMICFTWNSTPNIETGANSRCAVLVIGSDRYHPERIHNLRDELGRFSPLEVSAADDNPIDYLYPYIKASATHAAYICQHYVMPKVPEKDNKGDVAFHYWNINQLNHRDLNASLRSLVRFLKLTSDTQKDPAKVSK